jgi:hypothetical protein
MVESQDLIIPITILRSSPKVLEGSRVFEEIVENNLLLNLYYEDGFIPNIINFIN